MFVHTAILFILADLSCAFLYNKDNVVTFQNTGYFGYSVHLQKGEPSILLVGAPKKDGIGKLFVCDVNKRSPCKETSIPQYTDNGDGVLKDALYGATIDGGSTLGDTLMVCAPRYTIDFRLNNESNYFANGACYYTNNILNVDENRGFSGIFPNVDHQIQDLKYLKAFGQAGFSLHYAGGKEKEFLVGAPGIRQWAGGAIRLYEANDSLPPQTRDLRGETRYSYEHLKILEYKNDDYYTGYAVASGYIWLGQNKYYIIGIPKAVNLEGIVYIQNRYTARNNKAIKGHSIGEYFGSSLCVFDVNGDGFDDLLVGAPMFKGRSYDEGAVYEYINDRSGNLIFNKRIDMQITGARFGTSMTNLGKIALDNYEAVAISSPYEKNGAIYIYLGSRDGLSDKFYRIEMNDHSGFGFSLSKPVDVDNNGFSDLGVGAIKSNSAVILKARAVFYYIFDIETPTKLYNYKYNEPFNVKFCVNLNDDGNVNTSIVLTIDHPLINHIRIKRQQIITGQYCDEVNNVAFKRNETESEPVRVNIIATEEDCPTCPIRSPSYKNAHIHEIPFFFDCGDDQICTPDLKITSKLDADTLVLGTRQTMQLKINIENIAEDAYVCRLNLKLPEHVLLKSSPKLCEQMSCPLPNPLRQASIDFEVDFQNFNLFREHISFEAAVNCLNYTKVAVTDLNIKYQSRFEVTGSEQTNIYKNKNNTATITSTFEYFLINRGPSLKTDFRFVYRIPKRLKALENEDIFKIYKYKTEDHTDVSCSHLSFNFDEEPVEGEEKNETLFTVKTAQLFNGNKKDVISCDDASVECVTIECTASKVLKGEFIKMLIPIEPQFDTILQYYEPTFKVVASVDYYESNEALTVESSINYLENAEEKYLSWLWVTVGLCIGLLLLCGVIFLLYKLNFFQRTLHEKLQEDPVNEEAFELSSDNKTD